MIHKRRRRKKTKEEEKKKKEKKNQKSKRKIKKKTAFILTCSLYLYFTPHSCKECATQLVAFVFFCFFFSSSFRSDAGWFSLFASLSPFRHIHRHQVVSSIAELDHIDHLLQEHHGERHKGKDLHRVQVQSRNNCSNKAIIIIINNNKKLFC